MSKWQVPFTQDGDMLTWAYPGDGEHVWREPYEFSAVLRYEGFERGRSAAHILFRGDDGHRYYVFLTDLDHLFKEGGFAGRAVAGKWTFTKRGQNYGVRLVERN